jgi:hypothetical protein
MPSPNTEKEYFLNPELTMKKIFYLFCETYFIANGKELKLSYESLGHFFLSKRLILVLEALQKMSAIFALKLVNQDLVMILKRLNIRHT